MTAGKGWWGQRRNRQLTLIACFLLPSLAIFFLYRILPLGWNVILSFESWSPLKPAAWVGFEHYVEMWSYDDVFWVSLWNTLIFIAASPGSPLRWVRAVGESDSRAPASTAPSSSCPIR
jgi:ABC-type sugar transport system permease subunit